MAAAEEIFHVFESTIVKYEDEICASKLEIERLRGLLVKSASHQKAGLSSFCLLASKAGSFSKMPLTRLFR